MAAGYYLDHLWLSILLQHQQQPGAFTAHEVPEDSQTPQLPSVLTSTAVVSAASQQQRGMQSLSAVFARQRGPASVLHLPGYGSSSKRRVIPCCGVVKADTEIREMTWLLYACHAG